MPIRPSGSNTTSLLTASSLSTLSVKKQLDIVKKYDYCRYISSRYLWFRDLFWILDTYFFLCRLVLKILFEPSYIVWDLSFRHTSLIIKKTDFFSTDGWTGRQMDEQTRFKNGFEVYSCCWITLFSCSIWFWILILTKFWSPCQNFGVKLDNFWAGD